MVRKRKGKKQKAKKRQNGHGPLSLQNEKYILDRFTDVDLRKWKQISDLLNEFSYHFFYSLEAQRLSKYEELCESLQSSSNIPVKVNNWFRVVEYKYSLEPLSSKGSVMSIGGRFNFGSEINPGHFDVFNAFYLAEDSETALREYFGLGSHELRNGLTREELALTDPSSYSCIKLDGEINNIFDLTNESHLKDFIKINKKFIITEEVKSLAKILGIKVPAIIKTSKDLSKCLLEENWRYIPVQYSIPSNSQVFGKILYDSGFEGVIYPSTKGGGKCLAVFPQKFDKSDSYIKLDDSYPPGVQYPELNSETWDHLI